MFQETDMLSLSGLLYLSPREHSEKERVLCRRQHRASHLSWLVIQLPSQSASVIDEAISYSLQEGQKDHQWPSQGHIPAENTHLCFGRLANMRHRG